ncbi:hypothetical protein MMC21_000919 [Puttea exsequens]|nr:hypothetical protein [Puttea exsequens]
MARAFDESLPYQHLGSSMSSQTSLAGGRVYRTEGTSVPPYTSDLGSSWNTPRLANPPSKKTPRQKLPKIKSSPSHGALATARTTHVKLHRRGNSAASNTTSPTSPTFVPDFLQQSSISQFPASAHADPYAAQEQKPSSKSRVRIKPLLRKFSSQEKISLDLSRSAAENDALNIYASSDVTSLPSTSDPQRRGYHHRGASLTSQLSSTTTSSGRYANPYGPQRQTNNSSYTPPTTGLSSYKTSLESDATSTPFSESHSRHPSSQTTTTPTPYFPLPTPTTRRPNALHIRTSSAKSANTIATTHPPTPSSLRFPPTDPAPPSTSMDVTSPLSLTSTTARSSLSYDKQSRSRSNTVNTDPLSTVQAARAKFREQEAAKERKYAEAEVRRQEKSARQMRKREMSEQRSEERRERKRGRGGSSAAVSEKGSVGVLQTQVQAPLYSGEGEGEGERQGQGGRERAGTAGSKGEKVRSQWGLFWFRLRTVWLRLRRRMGGGSS